MLGAMNAYARVVLGYCVDGLSSLPPSQPPPGWPQADADPADMVAWIRARPFDKNAWGSGSHAKGMITHMLQWHRDGRLTLDPVIDAIGFLYDIQDPSTGLWGTADQPLNVRINGTFKLLTLLRESLKLPIPQVEAMIDAVASEFDRSDYETNVSACDEWDNLYVLALAAEQANDAQVARVREISEHRLLRSLVLFSQPDGGFSFTRNRCQHDWVGFDMAPRRPQADAMGLGVLSSGINVCVDLLGLHDASPWTGVWRLRDPEPTTVREVIRRGLVERGHDWLDRPQAREASLL